MSLVAIPANVLAEPAVAPATVFGFVAAAIAPVWLGGAQVLAWLAGWPCRWLVLVAERLGGLDGASLAWPGGVPGGLALLAVIATIVFLARRPGIWRLLAVGAVLAALIQIPVRAIVSGWPPPGWVMVACDIGQGDAIVLPAGRAHRGRDRRRPRSGRRRPLPARPGHHPRRLADLQPLPPRSRRRHRRRFPRPDRRSGDHRSARRAGQRRRTRARRAGPARADDLDAAGGQPVRRGPGASAGAGAAGGVPRHPVRPEQLVAGAAGDGRRHQHPVARRRRGRGAADDDGRAHRRQRRRAQGAAPRLGLLRPRLPRRSPRPGRRDQCRAAQRLRPPVAAAADRTRQARRPGAAHRSRRRRGRRRSVRAVDHGAARHGCERTGYAWPNPALARHDDSCAVHAVGRPLDQPCERLRRRLRIPLWRGRARRRASARSPPRAGAVTRSAGARCPPAAARRTASRRPLLLPATRPEPAADRGRARCPSAR